MSLSVVEKAVMIMVRSISDLFFHLIGDVSGEEWLHDRPCNVREGVWCVNDHLFHANVATVIRRKEKK